MTGEIHEMSKLLGALITGQEMQRQEIRDMRGKWEAQARRDEETREAVHKAITEINVALTDVSKRLAEVEPLMKKIRRYGYMILGAMGLLGYAGGDTINDKLKGLWQ